MSFVFFLFALFVGWSAWNVFRPVAPNHGVRSVASFLMGWLTGELALHHVVAQIAIAFLFVWIGAVDGFLGAVAMTILVVSWLSMSHFYLSGKEAGTDIEQALIATLGPDYRSEVREDLRRQFAEVPERDRLLLPFAGVGSDVEVIKNVRYGTNGQRLDIYRSRNAPERGPVLMQIHGGAWTEKMGSKNEQAIPLMAHMARRGWVAVTVSYRLSPGATFPEHLIDCKEGLKWIKEHVTEYGGDPDFVVVTGGSAGGHLSSLMALTAGDPEYQPGFEEADLSVQGAVPFYGAMDFTRDYGNYRNTGQDFIEATIVKKRRSDDPEAFERASPLYRIHASAPPFLIIHGDRDSLVPIEEGRAFAKKLRSAADAPVAYAEIRGAQHGFDVFPSLRSEYTKFGVERFLQWLYSRAAPES